MRFGLIGVAHAIKRSLKKSGPQHYAKEEFLWLRVQIFSLLWLLVIVMLF